ncbi:MAG TPA: hypothetical protein VGN73_00920 [Gemmatimonadaceae bacterium]|jgi:hypothetical protein|nr:hypothetical protein [Gemmatimonadaceae bacterium]
MRRLGEVLLILGAALGVLVAVAMVAHLGPGNSWLINVALAKLTLVAAGGLMGGGAVMIRLDNRERSKQLPDKTDQNTTA